MKCLVFPYHDPNGSGHGRLIKQMPNLKNMFDKIITTTGDSTYQQSIEVLEKSCDEMMIEPTATDLIEEIGRIRRKLLERAADNDYIMYCDGDRVLYWSENYPDELRNCVNNIHVSDFTIFGRTNRAWVSHLQTQHRKESIINELFKMKTGYNYDLLAAARGMSSKAAKLIVENSDDDTFGVDVSWPLMMMNDDNMSVSFVRTDGLSFETGDVEQSIDEWIHRIRVVLTELESMK